MSTPRATSKKKTKTPAPALDLDAIMRGVVDVLTLVAADREESARSVHGPVFVVRGDVVARELDAAACRYDRLATIPSPALCSEARVARERALQGLARLLRSASHGAGDRRFTLSREEMAGIAFEGANALVEALRFDGEARKVEAERAAPEPS